jgi:cysteine synthase A
LKSTSILDTIGHTPLVKIKKITPAPLYAKAEFLNPSGSVKDRVALYMIEQAEKKGLLRPDSIIVEPSSGNTGIGLAFVGVQKGYRVRIIMPGNMSEERKKIIKAFGGEVISTSEKESLEGAIRKAAAMQREDDRVYVPQQFENPANPEIHYRTTAVEIWEQTNGEISAFVAGVGSGGTLAGVGRFLKEKNRGIHLVAVEPANSAALLGHEPGLHQIQGIGDGFVPKILDVSIIDDVVTVSDEEAISTTRQLARAEGLLVGTSSGANVFAAMKISERLPGNIITILPDRAERYFSTSLI